jgi:hypothetical protein
MATGAAPVRPSCAATLIESDFWLQAPPSTSAGRNAHGQDGQALALFPPVTLTPRLHCTLAHARTPAMFLSSERPSHRRLQRSRRSRCRSLDPRRRGPR